MSSAAFADRSSYDAAVALARTAGAAYHDTGELVMVDADYDVLVARIAATRAEHPGWDDQGLLTEVAAGASAVGDVRHAIPMLSLDKALDEPALVAFVEGLGELPVLVEPKLDGLAVHAEYVDGSLVLVATRGNGQSGEDVTEQALRDGGIAGLPPSLVSPWSGSVRGEVYMTDQDFEAANTARVGAGGKPFVNPRNGVAGSLRKADRPYAIPMTCAVYDITADADSHLDRMGQAAALGFATAVGLLGASSTHVGAPAVVEAIRAIGARRAALGYPIDGAVVKVDGTAARVRLGSGSRTPYWAMAYKFAPDLASTTLLGIETSIGRTGRLGLTAVVEPVAVGGVTVSRASLHNVSWVQEQGLAIGQRVAVWRAGDVIPRVTAPIGEQPHDLTPWTPPPGCPQCGEEWDTTSLLWRCNTPTCLAAAALDYWCSGDALDVDRIGRSLCVALVEAGLARTVADLYDLTAEQLAELPMGLTTTGGVRVLGASNAAEIIAGLEASKRQPFNRVVTGLGIRMTGRSVGRWLAARFRTMEVLLAASVEEIAEIDRMGPAKAKAVVDGLARLRPVIDRLAVSGLAMGLVDDGGTKPLAGKTYVVSGSVPGYTRTTVAERIEELGGRASSSVSATTTALITSETTTAKAKAAAKHNVPVIAPQTFARQLEGALV
ncbi:MAG TPA: NAD-dependent DNA ligase LigA [Umezawaea sp.]|nr:NAD-dependent DNA ligase LigA [Umezawaea sp.]